ncbi:hypothetical protein [Apilactobacillus micheneri]|uniref:hypothetical protein n=1 Tax=Apilactobacillus micheneri TaxID=1899430 RepID=UPI000D024207|nr:hypothetical protein [Apilactobacillus micheneri]
MNFVKKYWLYIIAFISVEALTMFITYLLAIETSRHLFVKADEGSWLQSICTILGVILGQILVLIIYFVQRHFDRKSNLEYKKMSDEYDRLTSIDKKMVLFKPKIEDLGKCIKYLNDNCLNIITDGKIPLDVYSYSQREIIHTSQAIIDKTNDISLALLDIKQELDYSRVDGNENIVANFDNMKTLLNTMEAPALQIKSSFDYIKDVEKRNKSIDDGYEKLISHLNKASNYYEEVRKNIQLLKDDIIN